MRNGSDFERRCRREKIGRRGYAFTSKRLTTEKGLRMRTERVRVRREMEGLFAAQVKTRHSYAKRIS